MEKYKWRVLEVTNCSPESDSFGASLQDETDTGDVNDADAQTRED